MMYGLLAALGWGISGLAAAYAARRLGAFLTVITGEAVALAGFGTLLLAGNGSLRGAGPAVWPLLAAGVIGVAGYLANYRGLEVGQVGLVSAISATYGGVIAAPAGAARPGPGGRGRPGRPRPGSSASPAATRWGWSRSPPPRPASTRASR